MSAFEWGVWFLVLVGGLALVVWKPLAVVPLVGLLALWLAWVSLR